MFNLNKVLLAGNLTHDPDVRRTPGGMDICELKMAINRRTKSGDGQTREETCFVNVTVWGKQAEACRKFLAKGSGVYVEGRLVYETWEDRNTGARRSAHKVVADSVRFISGRDDNDRQETRETRSASPRNDGGRERRGGVSGEYGPPPTQNSPADNAPGDSDELPPF